MNQEAPAASATSNPCMVAVDHREPLKFGDTIRFCRETAEFAEAMCQTGDDGVAIAIAASRDGTHTVSSVETTSPGDPNWGGEQKVWLKGLEHLGPFPRAMFGNSLK